VRAIVRALRFVRISANAHTVCRSPRKQISVLISALEETVSDDCFRNATECTSPQGLAGSSRFPYNLAKSLISQHRQLAINRTLVAEWTFERCGRTVRADLQTAINLSGFLSMMTELCLTRLAEWLDAFTKLKSWLIPVRRRRSRPNLYAIDSFELRTLLAVAIPSVTIDDAVVTEGDSGTKNAVVTVRLSSPMSTSLTLNWATRNVTAAAGLDYLAQIGRAIIPAGSTRTEISVSVLGDRIFEPDEFFDVLVSGPRNVSFLKTAARIRIVENETRPTVSIGDVTVAEGAVAALKLQLSHASSTPILVSVATRDLAATSLTDYVAVRQVIAILAGQTSWTVSVATRHDVIDELDESLEIQLTAATGAQIVRNIANVTILDNDAPPIVSLTMPQIKEGNVGTTNVLATVSLTSVSGLPVSVDVAAAAITAARGIDFQFQNQTVTVPAGKLSVTIPIGIVGDLADEPSESFRLTISNARNATLNKVTQVLCVIPDDDGPILPLFALKDLIYLGGFRLPEGTFGSSTFDFAGNGLTFHPDRKSLFLASNPNNGLHVAEISIPEMLRLDGKTSLMPVARVLQPFRDLGRLLTINSDGRRNNPVLGSEELNLGGLLVADGGLTGSMFNGYTGAEPRTSSHTHFRTSTLNLSSLSSESFQGLLDIRSASDQVTGRVRAGYMARVPDQWQAWIGAEFVTGDGGQNRIQFSSAGPALFGFDAADPTGSSTKPLIYYPLDNPLQWMDPSWNKTVPPQLLFNGTSQVDGVVFAPGTRSVLFIGSNGVSSIGYGSGATFRDYARPYQGYHSLNGAYRYQIWSYDIDEIAAVRNGVKQPWQLKPTVYHFDLPTPEASKYLGGVAFDASTGRLYLAQKAAGPGYTPVIHVFQLGTPPVKSSAVKTSSLTNAGAVSSASADLVSDPEDLFDRDDASSPAMSKRMARRSRRK
jgi:hypothetical protein